MVGTSHEAHVCVFEKGSDECIICGVKAGLLPGPPRKLDEPAWRAAIVVRSLARAASPPPAGLL